MRIVYDDTHIQDLYEAVSDRLVNYIGCAPRLKMLTQYDHGMDRIQRPKLKEMLNDYLYEYGFSIGNDVHHANGIGNNCRYPVYYNNSSPNELQHCGYINLNTDMYSGVYVYISDYDNKKFGTSYKVTPRGVTRQI